jgi:hypothetical protein
MEIASRLPDPVKGMNINGSRPNDSLRDVENAVPRVVRVVRAIRGGPRAAGKASTLRTAASTRSSRQMAAFLTDHPTLTMLVLWLITLIGFVCIYGLPTR